MEFELVLAEGDLRRNGDDTIQSTFFKKFFGIHDKIKLTSMRQQYVNALEDIKRKNGTQVDWAKLPDLLKSMKGLRGTGYTAVMKWIPIVLDDGDIQNDITTTECEQLISLADGACTWRKEQIEVCSEKCTDDDGHRHALKMWKSVRNKLKEVKKKVHEINKARFYSDNNNFEDYNKYFK